MARPGSKNYNELYHTYAVRRDSFAERALSVVQETYMCTASEAIEKLCILAGVDEQFLHDIMTGEGTDGS